MLASLAEAIAKDSFSFSEKDSFFSMVESSEGQLNMFAFLVWDLAEIPPLQLEHRGDSWSQAVFEGVGAKPVFTLPSWQK